MADDVSRRDLFRVAGAAGAVAVVGPATAQTAAPGEARPASAPPADRPVDDRTLFFFNDPEARFVEAAAARLIPADERWGGAREAGVLYYIDRQLASAWGAGERMYLKGPWNPDAPPQQGYQLRHAPAELYRIGIEEARAHVRSAYGDKEFWDLGESVMDEVLTGLETGEIALPSIPSAVFFETLLANTVEGFFSDPAYGGNRGMIGWRMVGFPGAYAAYLDVVDQHGLDFRREPLSFANDAARRAHIAGHGHGQGAAPPATGAAAPPATGAAAPPAHGHGPAPAAR